MGRAWVFASLLFVACGNVDEPTPDAGIDAPTTGFTITATTTNAAVPIGGMTTIALQVTRVGGFAGDVTISAATPPAGLTVTPVTIAAADTTGAVIVSGAAPLTIGDMLTFTLEATADGATTQTVTIADALLTGRPGALDTSWGLSTGVASISFGSDDSGAFQQLDVINNRVFALGWSVGGLGAQRFVSTRFTAAGLPDMTFSSGGLVRTSFEGSSNEQSYGYATGTQTDGRSILIGYNGDANDIAVARLSLTGGNGGQDFGDMGKSLVNLGGTETVSDGLVLSTNQIIAVGSRNAQMFVARMTSTGNLDTTFNTPNGYATASLGSSSNASNVATDSAERLVVAGSFNAGSDSDAFIRRYAPTGALDGAFGGNNGVVISGTDSEVTVGLATLGDQVLIATNASTPLGARIRVRRYTAGGELDTTFGTAGIAEYSGSGAVDMAVFPDGRVVVLADAAGQAKVIRFTATGAIDVLFGTGTDGTSTITIGDGGLPTCIAVYNRHMVVIGGGNQGGVPGPGTFGIVARMWM